MLTNNNFVAMFWILCSDLFCLHSFVMFVVDSRMTMCRFVLVHCNGLGCSIVHQSG